MSLDSPKIPIAPVFLASNTNLFTTRLYTNTNFAQSRAHLLLSTEVICGCGHGVRTQITTYGQNEQVRSQITAYRDNERVKCIPKTFLLAEPIWLRKITTDPHILTHVSTVRPDDRYPKLKIYISTDFG